MTTRCLKRPSGPLLGPAETGEAAVSASARTAIRAETNLVRDLGRVMALLRMREWVGVTPSLEPRCLGIKARRTERQRVVRLGTADLTSARGGGLAGAYGARF